MFSIAIRIGIHWRIIHYVGYYVSDFFFNPEENPKHTFLFFMTLTHWKDLSCIMFHCLSLSNDFIIIPFNFYFISSAFPIKWMLNLKFCLVTTFLVEYVTGKGLYHNRRYGSWFPIFCAKIDHQVKGVGWKPAFWSCVFPLATCKCPVGDARIPCQCSVPHQSLTSWL